MFQQEKYESLKNGPYIIDNACNPYSIPISSKKKYSHFGNLITCIELSPRNPSPIYMTLLLTSTPEAIE